MTAFSNQQLKDFHDRGFVVARALADPTMLSALRAQIDRELVSEPMELEADVGYPGAPSAPSAPGGQTPRRLLQACQRGGALAAWAGEVRLIRGLGQLLDSSRVLLTQAHHNCVMTKYPSYSSDTHWHQDIRFWSFSPPRLINCWLALGKERQGNGGLRAIRGSHRWQMDPQQLDAGQFLRPEHSGNQAAIAAATPIDLDPGDVLFFNAALFHAANRNATDQVKLSVVYSYHDPATRPLPGTRSASVPELTFRVQ